MDYTFFFANTLTTLGITVVPVWNAFDHNYNENTGWPIKLPVVSWTSDTVLLMHFQDFVTHRDGRIVELDQLADHYGGRADQIIVTHMHHGLEKLYSGPVHLIEYSNHNVREMTRLLDRKDQWLAVVEQPKTQAWQCLNGRLCEHRFRAAAVLQHWPNGVLSLGTEIPLPRWHYGTYAGTENDENFVRLLWVYGSCAVNIITETQYNHWPGVISEKTLLAFVSQQLPVLISYAGAVADTRDLGFDMFDDIIDHSYDCLPNNQRAEQALLRNQQLIQSPPDLAAYQARLKTNRDHALYTLPRYYQKLFERGARDFADRTLGKIF